MCGRIALYTPPRALARLLDAALAAGLDTAAAPCWNLGPTRTLFGVADDHGARVLGEYRWGLVPWWSKDPTGSVKSFNARAETVATRPSFRDAYNRSQRLLLPVDGFFEWDRRGTTKAPHFFTRADGSPIVLAGLYDRWRDKSTPGTAPLWSCTVLTTTPGADMDGIHDRMPVVLEPSTFDVWLTARGDELDAIQALCRPADAGTLVHHPVDPRVGNVANDDPELITAVSGA